MPRDRQLNVRLPEQVHDLVERLIDHFERTGPRISQADLITVAIKRLASAEGVKLAATKPK